MNSNTLNTREFVLPIISSGGLKNNTIILDFINVNFVSRSFADEFFKQREELESKGVTIILQNANDSVLKMLDAVSRTQNKTNRKFNTIAVYNYSDKSSLSDFLLSI